eukprot:m.1943 g.1943  ORF g.1943 m.1943 type:complete len:596 (+) comp8082_c0_seq2:178-1965(+)
MDHALRSPCEYTGPWFSRLDSSRQVSIKMESLARKCSSCQSLLPLTVKGIVCNACLSSQINNVRLAAQDFEGFLVNCVRRIDTADRQVRQVEKTCSESIVNINSNAARLQLATTRIFDRMRDVLNRYEGNLVRQIAEEKHRKTHFLNHKRELVIDRRRRLARARAKCEDAQRQFDINKLDMLAKRNAIERELSVEADVSPHVGTLRPSTAAAAVRLNAHDLMKDLMLALPASARLNTSTRESNRAEKPSSATVPEPVQIFNQRPVKRLLHPPVASATAPPPAKIPALQPPNEVAQDEVRCLSGPEEARPPSGSGGTSSDDAESWPLDFELEHGKMVFHRNSDASEHRESGMGSGTEGTVSPSSTTPANFGDLTNKGVTKIKKEKTDDSQLQMPSTPWTPAPASSSDRNFDWCGLCYDGGDLLCCDNCSLSFHLKCVGLKGEPDGQWLCSVCRGRLVIPEGNLLPDEIEPGQECYLLLDLLYWHENSKPFREPVSLKQAPNYLAIVKKPVCLSDIKKNMAKGMYRNQSKFVEDVELIFSNCATYNINYSQVAASGKSLKSFFKQMLDKYAPHLVQQDGVAQDAPSPGVRVKQEQLS